MNDLIKAINKEFGEGKMSGAVFFEHNEDGTVKTMSPLFAMGPKMSNPNSKPGEGIQELVTNLKQWAKAIDYLADDMVKRALPKN